MIETASSKGAAALEKVVVRPMEERDLDAAAEVVQTAFGTFLGVEQPFGDKDYVGTRWAAGPEGALTAELDGEVVGSNFVTSWGTVGFFGPLTVRPELWDQGVASRLLEATDEVFARWETRHAGLFTFAHSLKHQGLYQKFGFWPRYLTALFVKAVSDGASPGSEVGGRPTGGGAARLSLLTEGEADDASRAVAELTDHAYGGLDVSVEMRAVIDQGLGEVLVLSDEGGAEAVAVCHAGAGTEAGTDVCYVKFGMARPGAGAERRFERLLDAVECYALDAGARNVQLGVNAARVEPYRAMRALGYRPAMVGVAMERGSDDGYNRPGVWLIDDWR